MLPLNVKIALEILDKISKYTPVVKEIRSYLTNNPTKSVYVKGKENIDSVLGYSEQYLKLKELAKEHPDIIKIPLIKKFLEENRLEKNILSDSPSDTDIYGVNYAKAYNDDGVAIVSRDIQNELHEIIKENRLLKEPKQKINVIPIKEARLFDDFKNETSNIKETDISKKLGIKYSSLLKLSIFVSKLYSLGNTDGAEALKYAILNRYGKVGLQFCNLYTRGYISGFLSQLADIEEHNKIKINYDSELDNLIDRDTDCVVFVHPRMKSEEIDYAVYKIRNSLDNLKDYIAVHSLGGAIGTAKGITKSVGIRGVEGKYKIVFIKPPRAIVPEFSKVWYKNSGEKIYLLIQPNG